jgi:hypothetical protein
MWSLFHSIFGIPEEAEHYPETLVNAAIERAVDGTDPWLRGLSGYRKKLRPAVIAAIDHVVTLVDSLAPPRPATRDGYGRDPLLQAMFLSSEQMQQVVREQLAAQPVEGDAACALLVDVLGRPQEHLWASRASLAVDRMGIKRAAASDEAPELTLEQLHNTEGRSVVVTLVEIKR